MSEDSESPIAALLEPYPDEIRMFAQDLRVWLKDETKPAFELVGKSAQSLNIGYGFTTTAWDCFCAIIVYRGHINLSFPSGASPKDPDCQLHGTGSRVRHLKIRELGDVQTTGAKQILVEARKRALFAGRIRDDDLDGSVTTVIKRR